MASLLVKERNYRYMAEKYSELNDFQIVSGKQLIELLSIKSEDKVLDIGCGTGEITAFIADIVGLKGLCVGVDPDKHRISIAKQKHCFDRKNLCFVLGDSSCDFPHNNEAFYDIVFCSFVIHWLNEQEKVSLLAKAFRCLKPGGRVGIISTENNSKIMKQTSKLLPDDEAGKNRLPFELIRKNDAEGMLERAGFEIQCGEYFQYEYTFPSLEYYLTWSCASLYLDLSKILPDKKEDFAREFVNKEDGRIYCSKTLYRIIARKRPKFFD